MAKKHVTYDMEMKERALAERKGLYTIEVINASKKPGKFGTSMTMQGPIDADEYRLISDFMIKTMKRRTAKAR